ncbi:hypothetical protein DV736_g6223, partial [Chaetothyriales sp. CBS 134916]
MFSALNRFIARLDLDQPAQTSAQKPGDNTLGFQVLRNTNKELPLERWFDFIVGINGHLIEFPDPDLFTTEIRNCAGNYCSLDLWKHNISEKPYGGSSIDPTPASNLNLARPPMINPKAESPSTAPAKTKKARHHPIAAPGVGFDEMFAEGEKKSKENDYVSSRKGTPLPPPPKLASASSASEQHPSTGEDLGEPGEAEES